MKLFSVDDHIIEPPNVWSDRLPAKHRDAGLRVVRDDGRDAWVYESERIEINGLLAASGRDGYSRESINYADMIAGSYDPAERAKDLRADGVYASVSFPTIPKFAGSLFLSFADRELADLSVRAYNDFMIDEWCPGGPPGMYVPTIISQLWDPELAAEEIRRCAERGARALSFPENTVPLGLPSYWTDHWDPVWQACQDHDIPICMHIGTSGQVPMPSPEAPMMLTFALFQVGSLEASVNLMMSPVCRKFPGLKFVFAEGGVGWAANALERADRMWEKHRRYEGMGGMLPSEVFRNNMYLCTLDEPVGLKCRDEIGIDHIF